MDSNHNSLAVNSFDSALKKDENYFPQVFFKECICVYKNVIKHIIDDLESSSDDSEKYRLKRLMFFENVLFEKVI